MVQHLQSERTRLLSDLRSLELSHESLKSQLSSLKDKTTQNQQENDLLAGNDRQRVTALEGMNSKLSKELDEIKKEFDMKLVENDSLKSELRLLNHKLEGSKEIQMKLEMENHHQADELDVARGPIPLLFFSVFPAPLFSCFSSSSHLLDKLSKLAKAEQTVEKYQKKLEEMMTVKKQNKELSEKLDQYLDKIHDLESSNKGMANLNKMIENYKNRSIELEREKFEMISSLQVVEQQLQQANSENVKLLESKSRYEEEVRNLTAQLSIYHEEADERGGSGGLGSGLLDASEDMESVPVLKEQIKKLERRLLHRSTDEGNGGEGVSLSSDVVILQQELEDLKIIRKEREDALVSARKQVSDLQNELSKAAKAKEESDKNSSSAVANVQSAKEVKEMTQKLAATTNTIKLLEERLKERETLINKLQQEKGKLENYAKRSLDTFKEKYMTILKTMQGEKKELIERIRLQTEKMEKNAETWRREERLLSSALFEVGVKIMDRKIQSQLNEPLSLSSNTFLSLQREALAKSSAVSANDPSRGSAGGTVESRLHTSNNPSTPYASPATNK
jgi:chromosome segregation ATPase